MQRALCTGRISDQAGQVLVLSFTGSEPNQAGISRHVSHSHGEVAHTVMLQPGVAQQLELQLSRGLRLRGQVRDGQGEPVAKVSIAVQAPGTTDKRSWHAFARTDEAGRFDVTNCPVGRVLKMEFEGKDIQKVVRLGVDPGAGELDVRVQRTAKPSVFITGVVRGLGGVPIRRAKISAWTEDGEHRPPRAPTDEQGVFRIGPVLHGTWRLVVRAEGYPLLGVKPRALVVGERWDLGDLTLPRGGTAIIKVMGADTADMHFMVLRPANGARWVVSADRERPTTSILTPDKYVLMAWGKKAVPQAVPFEIVADEQREVVVRTTPGALRRLAFEIAVPGAETGGGVTLKVHRGGTQVVDQWIPWRRGEPWGYDLWLEPGSYRVIAVGQRLRGEMELTVGSKAAGSATVRLLLQ